MGKKIDFHMHLGDIFHENLSILFKKPYQYDHRPYVDPFDELGASGYTTPLITPDPNRMNVLIDAGQYRTWEMGGYAAVRGYMEESGIDYVVNMPILPNANFEEGLACNKLCPGMLTFTCCDFDLPTDIMLKKLRNDIARGAKGLKLHPIVQNVSPRDERIHRAIELFGEMGMPILTHCGVNDYYRMDSPHHDKTNMEYGELYYALELIHKFPDYIIIPAHGGGTTGGEMEELAAEIKKNGWKHVYVETSHRGAPDMIKMIELFGEDHVMYGSDFPFQTMKYELLEAEKAMDHFGDPEISEKFYYRNAARLLYL